jgi:hypothetical protein
VLEFDMKPTGAVSKRCFSAFEDLTDALANIGLVQPARSIGDPWQAPARHFGHVGNNDLVGIRVDDQIGVMSHHDYLSLPLCSAEEGDQLVIDRFGAQILFRLVDDQTFVVGIVQCEE